MDSKAAPSELEAVLLVGPSAIAAYSRLSYTLYYALAEFVDNSTQSRENYSGIIDDVLAQEKSILRVDISFDRVSRVFTIRDNSIGMTREKLIAALRIAQPTADSRGRSKYGMGMKTAACWIGNKWSVTTCEWSSGKEWTAEVDVKAVANGNERIPLKLRDVDKSIHGTTIKIWDLNRSVQQRTEETIMIYLGSMYRMDIRNRRLILTFNENPVPLPEQFSIAKADDGKEQRETFDTTIGGKQVKGWFGVLEIGGRKFGGFSLFQNDRQIRGFPDGWKPKAVFGGIEDEGSNTLVAQRLTGEIILDGFDVSHTKDAILYRGTEEEELERFLVEATKRLKSFASTMRKNLRGTSWSREQMTELFADIKAEFGSPEMRDVINEGAIPPLDLIKISNQQQMEDLGEEDVVWSMDIGGGIRIKTYLQDRSPNDPYVTICSDAGGALNVIINLQHPYYVEIASPDRADEIIRQYIYDAVAEYRVLQRLAQQPPDAVRKMKDTLLRAKIDRIKNEDDKRRAADLAKLKDIK